MNDQESKSVTRPSLLLGLCYAVVACSAGFHAPLAAATATAPVKKDTAMDASCSLNGKHGIEAEVLHRVNALRAIGAVCGTTIYAAAAPLSWNTQLQQAASDHSSDMAQNNYFSHKHRDGSTPAQRIRAAGYNSAYVGENIAAGQPTVEKVLTTWMHSPEHCKNLMNPKFRNVAVACARNDAATYHLYWTMDLGRI